MTPTSRRPRRAVVTVAVASLAVFVAACGGDAADPTASAVRHTGTTEPTTTTVRPRTSPPTTTTPATTSTSTTTSTVPAPAPLTITAVAEFPGRFIDDAFVDDGSFVALSHLDDPMPVGTDMVSRLDVAGGVLAEVETDDQYFNVFGLPSAAGGRFLYSQFVTGGSPENPFSCGFRQIDPGSLTLGPLLAIRHDSSCGGGWTIDDIDPAVIWAAVGGQGAVARVDTRSGEVTAIPVGPSVPTDYDLGRVLALAGVVYVELTAAYDHATGQYATAEGGPALPDQLLRVDPAAGPTAVAQLAGPISVLDGQLVVTVDEERSQLLDPLTLTATATGPATFDTATADPVSWATSDGSDPTMLAVVRLDDQGEVTAQGYVPTGFEPDGQASFTRLEVGDSFYVIAAYRKTDPVTATSTSITRLYQISG